MRGAVYQSGRHPKPFTKREELRSSKSCPLRCNERTSDRRGATSPLAKAGSIANYSITSSERVSSERRTTVPNTFAVFRLMASTNFIGCSMGRSLGLARLSGSCQHSLRSDGAIVGISAIGDQSARFQEGSEGIHAGQLLFERMISDGDFQVDGHRIAEDQNCVRPVCLQIREVPPSTATKARRSTDTSPVVAPRVPNLRQVHLIAS